MTGNIPDIKLLSVDTVTLNGDEAVQTSVSEGVLKNERTERLAIGIVLRLRFRLGTPTLRPEPLDVPSFAIAVKLGIKGLLILSSI